LKNINLGAIASFPAPARIITFLLVLVLGWSPAAAAIYSYFYFTSDLNDPGVKNLLNILVMGGLGLFFIVMLPWWSKQVYGRQKAFGYLGLTSSRRNGLNFLQGWVIGITSLMFLYFVQGWLGWLTWQPTQVPWGELIGGGLLSSIGVGLVEELVFRGWILTELEADYSPSVSLWSNALIFAALHFGKPLNQMLGMLPQFPGLAIMGALMVIAKRSMGNLLGISIGLHAGIIGAVYLVDVGKMVKYTNQVSDWITGIGGMPSAGLMGILGLANLAMYFHWLGRSKQQIS
jgi:uncharacterized protein